MTAPAPERPIPNEPDEPLVPTPAPDVPPPHEPPAAPEPIDPIRPE